MNRAYLGKIYGRGNGIEVGALHSPWIVPETSTVEYVDKMNQAELIATFPELSDQHIRAVHTVDDAETLSTVPDNKYDFLCSSHVFEHMNNCLGALENWLRVVKPGGYVLLAIPDRRFTFDNPRTATTFDHIWAEYKDPKLAERMKGTHYREFLSLVNKLEGATLDEEIKKAHERNWDTHFHCWESSGIYELLENFASITKFPYRILERHDLNFEVLAVLQRL